MKSGQLQIDFSWASSMLFWAGWVFLESSIVVLCIADLFSSAAVQVDQSCELLSTTMINDPSVWSQARTRHQQTISEWNCYHSSGGSLKASHQTITDLDNWPNPRNNHNCRLFDHHNSSSARARSHTRGSVQEDKEETNWTRAVQTWNANYQFKSCHERSDTKINNQKLRQAVTCLLTRIELNWWPFSYRRSVISF